MNQSNKNVTALTSEISESKVNDNSLDAIDSLLGESDVNDESNAQDFYKSEYNDDETPEAEAEAEAETEAEAESETEENDDDENAETESIDYDQEIDIPMPYGMEKMSLSEMKDKVSNMHMETKRIQEQENTIMIQRQEINAIMQSIGDVPPELTEALKQQHKALLVRENDLMLNAVPDWNDAKVFTKDRGSMESLTKSYGFSEYEFNHVSDHRLVKMIRDFSLLKSKLEKADPRKIKPNKQKVSRNRIAKSKNDSDFINEAASSNNQNMKQAAIKKLLE